MSASTGAATAGWRQVATDPPQPPSWAATTVSWVLVALPMFVQLTRLTYARSSVALVLLVALAVIAIGRASPALSWIAAAAAVPLAQRIDPMFARPPIVLVMVLSVLWPIATGSSTPGVQRWPTTRSLRLMLAPLLLADVSLLVQVGIRIPFLLVGVASLGLLLCCAAPGATDRWMSHTDTAVERLRPIGRWNASVLDVVGHWLGTALGVLAMVPAALLSMVVWAGHRLARFDPLDPPTWPDSRWVRRNGDDAAPVRAFAEVRCEDPRGLRRTVHRTVAGIPALLVSVALVAGIVLVLSGRGDQVADRLGASLVTAENCGDAPDAAMAGQDSWPEVGCQTTEFALRARFDAVTAFSFEDYASRWVNVTDGVRRTWQPPPCADCPRVTVWWFGGSAAWGYYQADDRTLPSQLARAAWEHGVALEITNYATPGWTLGQETRKFAELTTTEPAPDVVMFYDGANDLVLQKSRNEVGRGDDESEISFAEDALDDVLANGPFDWGLRASDRSTDADTPPLGPAEVARHGMERYARNVELATRIADSVGTTAVFVWQPILPTAPRDAGDEAAMDPSDEEFWTGAQPTIRRLRPAQVLDLSDSLDGVDRVVFKDYVHTSEFGAEVVARELERQVRDRAVAPAQERPSPPPS